MKKIRVREHWQEIIIRFTDLERLGQKVHLKSNLKRIIG